MDANGLNFRMLADANDWLLHGTPPPHFDTERRVLRLASARLLDPAVSAVSEEQVAPLVEIVPQSLDARGLIAHWNPGRNAITVDFERGVGRGSAAGLAARDSAFAGPRTCQLRALDRADVPGV